jgi:hypothetical protein
MHLRAPLAAGGSVTLCRTLCVFHSSVRCGVQCWLWVATLLLPLQFCVDTSPTTMGSGIATISSWTSDSRRRFLSVHAICCTSNCIQYQLLHRLHLCQRSACVCLWKHLPQWKRLRLSKRLPLWKRFVEGYVVREARRGGGGAVRRGVGIDTVLYRSMEGCMGTNTRRPVASGLGSTGRRRQRRRGVQSRCAYACGHQVDPGHLHAETTQMRRTLHSDALLYMPLQLR